jgi:hypothetical protein
LRHRHRVIESLESAYRTAYADAEKASDNERMQRLDFDFQRDQVFLEVLLDARDLMQLTDTEDGGDAPSLLERAKALKDLTKLR